MAEGICIWSIPIWDCVRAMQGPCLDPVLPSFRSRPAKALEFSRLSQHGITCMTMEYLPFETMFGPFLAIFFCCALP